MLTFIIRRLLAMIPVGIGVVAVVSSLIHAVPGDPVEVMLSGTQATEEEKTALRHDLGLDRPFAAQLTHYFTSAVQGDLGESLIYRKPVMRLIGERLRPTLELASLAMAFAMLISIPLGVISAVRVGKPLDYGAMGLALIGVAMPNFWLGPMLVLLFALELGWLPVSERLSAASYVLPALTLGLPLGAVLSRMTRNAMLDCFGEDYVRTARAKGASAFRVTLKHVLRNASLPIVTVIGLQFGTLLTGAIITERIYDWPGLGSLILDGIGNRDYPVVQGCVLVFSLTYLVVNLLTDLGYAAVDPRIRIGH